MARLLRSRGDDSLTDVALKAANELLGVIEGQIEIVIEDE